MTSRERMIAAMSGDPPDRVPVMCQLSIGHMLRQTGADPVLLWHDIDTYVSVLFQLRDVYGFDGILVTLHGHPPAWRSAIQERGTSPSGEPRLCWADGSITDYPNDDLPRHVPAHPLPVKPLDEIDPAAVSEDIRFIPVSQGLRFPIHPSAPTAAIERVVEESAGRWSVHGEVTSPFDYYLDMVGHENGLMGLIDHPERVAAIMDVLAEGVSALAAAIASTGVDAVKISSPFAGAGFISPSDYARFVLPFERRVIDRIHQCGVFAYLHTCGSIGDRLDLMAQSGADGLECLDPPPLGTVDLAEAVSIIGRSMFIKGNMDSVNTLLHGERERILADARERISAGRKAKGFVLSTACSVAPMVPRENLALLREAVDLWG